MLICPNEVFNLLGLQFLLFVAGKGFWCNVGMCIAVMFYNYLISIVVELNDE